MRAAGPFAKAGRPQDLRDRSYCRDSRARCNKPFPGDLDALGYDSKIVVNFEETKKLAENWFEPRIEEQQAEFPRAVQRKLGEFAARNTVHSPPAYAAIENVAFEHIEGFGRTILNGYKQAINALDGTIDYAVVAGIKRELSSAVRSESERVHGIIGYVREACKPSQVTTADQMTERPLQKLNADLDLFCAKLNTERGRPTFGWKPDIVKQIRYRVYEQGQLMAPGDVQRLINRMYEEPETEIRYYYQDGTEIDASLADALNKGTILAEWEWRFFKRPDGSASYVKIERGHYKWPWQKELAEKTPEFVEGKLTLSQRTQRELEEHYREHLRRTKYTINADRILDALWVVESEQELVQGTAFRLAGIGLITCAHVIREDSVAFRADRKPDEKLRVRILHQNATVDLAIFTIESDAGGALEISDRTDVRRGDEVIVGGFPNFRSGDTGFVDTGLITGFRVISTIRRMLTNAHIVAGTSGGPVLGTDGKVIGVAVTGSEEMVNASETENHGIIPITAVELLIK